MALVTPGSCITQITTKPAEKMQSCIPPQVGGDTAPAQLVLPAGAVSSVCPTSALYSHVQTPDHMIFLAKLIPLSF